MNPAGTHTPDKKLSQVRVKGEIPAPVLINWLTAAAIPLLMFFAWRAVRQDVEAMAPIWLTIFATLLGVNAALYYLLRNDTLQRHGFIALIVGLFGFLAISAVENGSAIIWLFAYPPVIFYISQARGGLISCAGGIAGLILLFSPLGDTLFNTPYSTSLRLNMIIVLSFEMVVCYMLDQSRRRSKLGLIKVADELEYAAKHDALTGLANRRKAIEQLKNEYDRYRRTERPFSVLLIDIDLFKSINDTYGHQAGDEVIVVVADCLRQQCRRVDTPTRWGGEEFLVLLPETDAEGALQIGNRVRCDIESASATVQSHTLGVTVSIGVGTIQDDESIDRLLQRTDGALYSAKEGGRNLVWPASADSLNVDAAFRSSPL